MIYRFACDLGANLQARQYPVDVWYGPERVVSSGVGNYRVLVARDSESGDTISPPVGFQRSPRLRRVLKQGVIVRVYAQSALAGARLEEHQAECDLLRDAVVTAIDTWAVHARAGVVEFSESRYLSPEEMAGVDVTAGVVYQLRFTIPRAVVERKYSDPELHGSPASADSSVRVSLDETTFEDV